MEEYIIDGNEVQKVTTQTLSKEELGILISSLVQEKNALSNNIARWGELTTDTQLEADAIVAKIKELEAIYTQLTD